MMADPRGSVLLHRTHHPRVNGDAHDLLFCGVTAPAPPRSPAALARLHRPELGDALHGLYGFGTKALVQTRARAGRTGVPAMSCAGRQSVAADLQFLDAWNKGEIPEVWAYLRARQLSRVARPAP